MFSAIDPNQDDILPAEAMSASQHS